MDYLPLFFDLRGRDCLVVGGDAVAARKAELLMRAGANVRLLAETLGPELSASVRAGQMAHVGKALVPQHFTGCALAIVATEDTALAEHAAQVARAAGVPVNAVDRPALCDAIIPAIVDREPVLVAISTGGAAPVLGRLLRARLEALLPMRLGRLAEMARERRAVVAARLAPDRRRRFWESVLQGPVAELVFSGRDAEAAARMDAELGGDGSQVPAAGEIYLVSVPDDDNPERLTLRAVRLLQQADLVFHDADLSQALIDLVRRDAERRAIAKQHHEACLREARARALEGRRIAWFVRAGQAAGFAAALTADGITLHSAGCA